MVTCRALKSFLSPNFTLMSSPPFINRLIVGTLAVVTGAWVFWDTGKDFEFIKYTPHTPEEVEKRKREHKGLLIKHLETCTLDYTPEAKARLEKLVREREKNERSNE